MAVFKSPVLHHITPLLLVIIIMLGFAESTEIMIGGEEAAWAIPPSVDTLNNWASKIRFKIGDSLVWKYDVDVDSVLEVTYNDYLTCNIANPIAQYKDGNTKVELKHSGPFYFVSGGSDDNCKKGEKLIIVVVSSEHDKPPKPVAVSPAPAADLAADGMGIIESPAPAPAPVKGGGHGLNGGIVGVVVGSLALLTFM